MKPQALKIVRILLIVLLLLSAAVYAVFMPQMSAAGWQYNVDEGNYPQLFAAFATWMRIGSVLICAGVVLCLLGLRVKLWICNLLAVLSAAAGLGSCLTVLWKFTKYADLNFPGMDETMRSVSGMYRDRLLPVIFPVALLCILCVWQLTSYEVQVYRKQQQEEKRLRDEAQAPKILD